MHTCSFSICAVFSRQFSACVTPRNVRHGLEDHQGKCGLLHDEAGEDRADREAASVHRRIRELGLDGGEDRRREHPRRGRGREVLPGGGAHVGVRGGGEAKRRLRAEVVRDYQYGPRERQVPPGHQAANFNPAVTLTLYLTKTETDVTKVAAYMGTQIIAGICAGFTYFAVFGEAKNLAPGAHPDHGEFGLFGAAVIEILYTFVLCFVVLRGAVIAEKNNESFGMAIAFSVVAGGYAGGWISGGCFNPAVAFGLDVSSAHMGFSWCLAYTAFEFV